jgi:signal peptide peptidase SppA
MTGRYEHVLGFALDHPWAITKPMLTVIANIIGRHVAGQKLTAEEIQAALVDRKNLPQPTAGGAVAVIPIYGVIAPRLNLLSDFSGGTTFESLTGQLRGAVANKAIKTIVLDINSPGGSVAGATEFAREVMAARAKKPIIAHIHPLGASAAYWVAAAATEVVASPSALVGSVGVYTAHDDLSAALEQLGVKRTYLSAGRGKVAGNEAEPLSDEAAARMQALIDESYGRFVGDVVKGRGKGMTTERVRNDWQAHVYGATEALSLGLIDSIATLDDTIARVMSPASADGRAARAEDHTSACSACNGSGLKPERFMADPQGQEPCEACHGTGTSPSTTAATLQRLPTDGPTSQEPPSDAQWQNAAWAALLDL